MCVSVCAPFFPLNYLRVVCNTILSVPCWGRETIAKWFWDCFWNMRKSQMYHQLLSNSITPIYSFNISAVSLRTKIFFHTIVINFWIFNIGKVLWPNLQCISNFVNILIMSFRAISLPIQYPMLHLGDMFLLSLWIWIVPHHLSFIINNTHIHQNSRINPYLANAHMNFSNFPRQS